MKVNVWANSPAWPLPDNCLTQVTRTDKCGYVTWPSQTIQVDISESPILVEFVCCAKILLVCSMEEDWNTYGITYVQFFSSFVRFTYVQWKFLLHMGSLPVLWSSGIAVTSSHRALMELFLCNMSDHVTRNSLFSWQFQPLSSPEFLLHSLYVYVLLFPERVQITWKGSNNYLIKTTNGSTTILLIPYHRTYEPKAVFTMKTGWHWNSEPGSDSGGHTLTDPYLCKHRETGRCS